MQAQEGAAPVVRPCNPTTAKTVPTGDAWLHEPKLDGYRLQVIKEGRRVRLSGMATNGPIVCPTWSMHWPGIPCRSAVIDAELVLPGTGGAPDFYRMPAAMRCGADSPIAVQRRPRY